MKLWDVQEMKCLGILRGHKGSVKSIASHPTNHGTYFILFHPRIFCINIQTEIAV